MVIRAAICFFPNMFLSVSTVFDGQLIVGFGKAVKLSEGCIYGALLNKSKINQFQLQWGIVE
jgi:hypothetical protein